MKKISFGKATLLVFMILAAGAVLAMPVSAGQNMEQKGSYDVVSSAYWTGSKDSFYVLGTAEEGNGAYASLTMKVTVSGTRVSFGPFRTTASSWAISSGIHNYSDSVPRRSHDVTTSFTSSLGSSGSVLYTL